MRPLYLARTLGLLAASAMLTACGDSYTVGDHTLAVKETVYGASQANGLFCDALDVRGQYQIVLTDFSLCSTLASAPDDRTVFHSTEETNLRLVFSSHSSVITKYPSPVTLTVGKTYGCTDNPDGAEAAAIFAHNGSGPSYDFVAEADSGTITVNYFVPPSNASGTFDLHFGKDHIEGSFDASYCANLVPGLEQ